VASAHPSSPFFTPAIFARKNNFPAFSFDHLLWICEFPPHQDQSRCSDQPLTASEVAQLKLNAGGTEVID
jgi:hypothetical protein